MTEARSNRNWAIFLVVYIFILGIGAAGLLLWNFPSEKAGKISFPHKPVKVAGSKTPTTISAPGDTNTDSSSERDSDVIAFVPLPGISTAGQGLIVLAFLAGMAGSFIHAAQSIASFVGNGTFKSRWAPWYLMRPWIGGVLGLAIYVTFRAGLVTGAGSVNPFGVVALGLLGGWFSKTTTDKLQEVFETLFKTDEDKKRKDKLKEAKLPQIERLDPSTLAAGVRTFSIIGKDFAQGASVIVNGVKASTVWESETSLKATLGDGHPREGEVMVQIENPNGANKRSEAHKLALK